MKATGQRAEQPSRAMLRRILGWRRGRVFTSREFLDLASRAAVDQCLARLVKAGRISRVARGVFVLPEESRFVGSVPPSAHAVVAAMAKAQGAVVDVGGAEAARYFGLTTQVPVKPVFYTTGSNRRFKMGELEVVMKAKRPRKLLLAGSLAGRAISALWYLGKGQVTVAVIEALRKRLPPTEFARLLENLAQMPGWMARVFRQHQASCS